MKNETLIPKEKSVDEILEIVEIFKKSFPEFAELDTPEATQQFEDVMMLYGGTEFDAEWYIYCAPKN